MESETTRNIRLIKQYLLQDHHAMYRKAADALPYPFITPGSDQYSDVLWDWDSWLTNVALRQIVADLDGKAEELELLEKHEKGCIRNWLHIAKKSGCKGWLPVYVERSGVTVPDDIYAANMHKPCLAQHAAFLVRANDGDAGWLREDLMYIQYFVNNYRSHHRHDCGLYFWQNDDCIGVDTDPCTFGRPARSSGSIYLNCLMYRELLALGYLLECEGLDEVAAEYRADAEQLKNTVQDCCWDPRDGFYYSVDLNLAEPHRQTWQMHSGRPREWQYLIQRIGVWSGFMPMWAEIANREQAQQIVERHYRDTKSFNAPFGVRTLSKWEKMYSLKASGNPSSWLGPIWGISNYMTWRGLVKYGFNDDAKQLAEKTIRLFASDLEKTGGLHEYYQPENGLAILNKGFLNWNLLVLNMIAWLENRTLIEEF